MEGWGNFGSQYVCGFLFDGPHVALIWKQKPDWQRGKLNGIGGKIEPGENRYDAMRREFREETGADIQSWKWFVTCSGGTSPSLWTVHFFTATDSGVSLQSLTEEVPVYVEAARLGDLPIIPNLHWLVPMARYSSERSYFRAEVRE